MSSESDEPRLAPEASPNDEAYTPPFTDREKLARRELAGYLHRLGKGLACRFDVPALCLEDVRWAAAVFADLGRELEAIAYDGSRADIYRVLGARYAMEQARSRLARQVMKAPHTSKRSALQRPLKRKRSKVAGEL